MALAYRAGAPLKDMEFVQYHPTGLPFTGILITEAARAEGGWLLNKDGYRYLQDYDLGTPTPTPVLRSMELGPARPAVAGVRARGREGADHRHAVRAGRAPRPAPPRREADRHQAAVRARAVPEVRAHRPGHRADPGAAGRALHDGRGPHRHRRRDAARRAVRRRRGRVREHQRRQPAGLELAARAAGVRRPRRPGGRRVRRHVRPAPPAVHRAQAADERRRLERDSSAPRRPATTRSRPSATRCRRRWRRAPASTAPGRRWRRAPTRCGELQERVARGRRSRTTAGRSTPSWSRRSSWPTCSTSPRASSQSGAARARSRAARTSAPTSRPATTSGSSPTRWSTATPDGSRRVEYLPVTITRWPPGERVYGR